MKNMIFTICLIFLSANLFGYYNPEQGRWTSRDPIGERGGLNLYGMVNNNAISKWDLLGNAACKCGPDITAAFYGYVRSVSEYLKKITSDKTGPIDGMSTLADIGNDIDFWYTRRKDGCATAGCERTVFFNGKCVRATVVNNILFGIVSNALGVFQDDATSGANLHNLATNGILESSEQEGAYDIGYDIWDQLSENATSSNEDFSSTIDNATVYLPINSFSLWYNSFDAVSEDFTNCKPCGKSIKIDEVTRVGIGFFMGTDVPQ